MPQPTSFEYFGSRSEQLAGDFRSNLQNFLNNTSSTINNALRAVVSVGYGLRKEVPFERWFADNGFQKPIDNPANLMQARLWAAASACESGVRMVAAVATYLFSLAFNHTESDTNLSILKAQGQSLALSLYAVYSPNDAKKMADNNGNPLIGISFLNWKWGTLYTGS